MTIGYDQRPKDKAARSIVSDNMIVNKPPKSKRPLLSFFLKANQAIHGIINRAIPNHHCQVETNSSDTIFANKELISVNSL